MKILQINAVNALSSTGKICLELADFLNSNGHEGYIAYSGGIPYSRGYKIGTTHDKKLHALLSRVTGKQAYFSGKSTRKLLKYTDKLKPDVVHLHNLHSNYIHLGLLLSHLAKNDIPTVLTLHDCWFYTGKCTHYTIDKCYKWQSGCGNCPRLGKDNPSWFFDNTAKMWADKKEWFSGIPRLSVIGVSDWVTGEARKSFLSSAKILTRIYNWINLEVFRPVDATELRKNMGLDKYFVILGVASVWSNSKGFDNFINLASLISSDFKIILIGRIKNKHKLPSNIIHIDETHNMEELARYYSLADVYVHLSPEETFGKTIAEAMACGTPAIVYNSTACPELIAEGCGYVIEKHDNDALYKTIKRIKEEGKNKYSENCIRHVKEDFNYYKQVEKIIEVYKRIMQ